MRLIDADALKRAIATIMPSRVEVNLVVDDQPDAIVLCKDCKKATRFETEYGNEIYLCDSASTAHYSDWFCADGTRKIGEKND